MNSELIAIFVKAFAVVLGLIYLIYTIVLQRQVVVMTRSLITPKNNIFIVISFLQILVAIFLILLAFIIL